MTQSLLGQFMLWSSYLIVNSYQNDRFNFPIIFSNFNLMIMRTLPFLINVDSFSLTCLPVINMHFHLFFAYVSRKDHHMIFYKLKHYVNDVNPCCFVFKFAVICHRYFLRFIALTFMALVLYRQTCCNGNWNDWSLNGLTGLILGIFMICLKSNYLMPS